MGRTYTTPQGQLSLFDINTDTDNMVVSSNSMLLGKRNLKINSAKVIATAIMQIKKEDEELKTYAIKIKDLAKITGLDISNLYRQAPEIVDDISDHPIFVRLENEKGELQRYLKIPWVRYCAYDKKEGIIIRFNDELKPYLLGLKENYAQYELANVVRMQSNYGIRLFEVLNAKLMLRKPPRNGTYIELSIDEIKEYLGCDQKAYENKFSNFKSKVIDCAVNDINSHSYWTVQYETLKTGREITDIRFFIKPII